ncbi:MAG: bifunctional phosphoribosylaminoimidazolecarboxamide formyltransferase/IMP cyclohydrolase [Planctomycetota bacterium]|nr:bifunctional phosphoribosylaminoimidazolecarboxamide formyltransferase/IMP cyclohydrolase [Planctomycetota bacterium]
MTQYSPIRRALISVSDKTGLAGFAKGLAAQGVEIYSTGGTYKFLTDQGIAASELAQYTGFPEVMDGRVKTLHPKIFGGILARRDRQEDLDSLSEHSIAPIDLVVVNLYPFEATVAKPGVRFAEAVEQIDIGGPSLIRAASKNHAFVTVATSPAQYGSILAEFQAHGGTSHKLRLQLALECFESTASYDSSISKYLASQVSEKEATAAVGSVQAVLPDRLHLDLTKVQDLRYGENPHQQAALYSRPSTGTSLVQAKQLHGKELSYNNLLDADSAYNIVRCFARPSAVVVKHNNPCGAASAHKLSAACRKALDGDPQSAFGGILGFNQCVDAETANELCQPGLFIEAIVAPEFSDAAIEILSTKPKWRENVRLIAMGKERESERPLDFRFVRGGVLVQQADTLPPANLTWKTVTTVPVADELWDDIAFGWEMVRHVKSNAIVLARDAALVGVGAGQMSRVDSVEIAISKAADRSRGSILASDAFFPFPDSIHRAAQAGIVAIVQPGGSKKDDEVIAACNEHRIPMLFTGQRHFRH